MVEICEKTIYELKLSYSLRSIGIAFYSIFLLKNSMKNWENTFFMLKLTAFQYFWKKIVQYPLHGIFIYNDFYTRDICEINKENWWNWPGLLWVYQNNWGSKNILLDQIKGALQLCKEAFFDKMRYSLGKFAMPEF